MVRINAQVFTFLIILVLLVVVWLCVLNTTTIKMMPLFIEGTCMLTTNILYITDGESNIEFEIFFKTLPSIRFFV